MDVRKCYPTLQPFDLFIPSFVQIHSSKVKTHSLYIFFRFNKLFWQIVKKKFYLNTRAKSERKWVTTILVHLCSWSSIQGLSTQIFFVNIFSCLMNEWMNEVQYWVQLPIKKPQTDVCVLCLPTWNANSSWSLKS